MSKQQLLSRTDEQFMRNATFKYHNDKSLLFPYILIYKL